MTVSAPGPTEQANIVASIQVSLHSPEKRGKGSRRKLRDARATSRLLNINYNTLHHITNDYMLHSTRSGKPHSGANVRLNGGITKVATQVQISQCQECPSHCITVTLITVVALIDEIKQHQDPCSALLLLGTRLNSTRPLARPDMRSNKSLIHIGGSGSGLRGSAPAVLTWLSPESTAVDMTRCNTPVMPQRANLLCCEHMTDSHHTKRQHCRDKTLAALTTNNRASQPPIPRAPRNTHQAATLQLGTLDAGTRPKLNAGLDVLHYGPASCIMQPSSPVMTWPELAAATLSHC
jgi:hypothetical protein